MRARSEFSGMESVKVPSHKRQECVHCKVSPTGVELLQVKPEVC